MINILVFLKYLTWWINNLVVKTLIFVCQIIHFCTSFTYGRSDSIIYERKKKLFCLKSYSQKIFGGFFRSITSNPSKLQENLISRRVVGINGLKGNSTIVLHCTVVSFTYAYISYILITYILYILLWKKIVPLHCIAWQWWILALCQGNI